MFSWHIYYSLNHLQHAYQHIWDFYRIKIKTCDSHHQVCPPFWIQMNCHLIKLRFHLLSLIHYSPGNRDAFCVWILCCDRFLQFFNAPSFFQLFHQTFHCFLRPLVFFLVVTFFPTKQPLYYWRCKRRQHGSHVSKCLYIQLISKLPNWH